MSEHITWALVRAGEAALLPLMHLLKGRDPRVRYDAAHVLGKIGDSLRALGDLGGASVHEAVQRLQDDPISGSEVLRRRVDEDEMNTMTRLRTALVEAAGTSDIPRSVDLDSRSGDNGIMKTTVDIPENELRDAMRFTKAKTKREAVVKVLEDFNRRRRMAELVKYSGTFSNAFPTNDEIEAVDTARERELNGRPRR